MSILLACRARTLAASMVRRKPKMTMMRVFSSDGGDSDGFGKKAFTEAFKEAFKETEGVDGSQIYETFIGTMKEALKDGKKVRLKGLGTFQLKTVPARTVKNSFGKGTDVDIPEKKTVKMTVSPAFKSELNEE